MSTHMARETREAPEVVGRLLEANRAGLAEFGRLVTRPSHFVTCARGASDHAASYFKHLAEILLGVRCCSIGASVVSVYGVGLRLHCTILITASSRARVLTF
jgi:glutamine---fructose-6-phosphate transaminase (isomerizing)